MKIVSALAWTLLAFVAVSCGAGSILVPESGPNTAWPCGLQAVSCGHHMCCDGLDSLCGAEGARCPVDQCCYAPDETGYGASHELKVRGSQRPEDSKP